jgi:putative hydrolase of the HAD superfamily
MARTSHGITWFFDLDDTLHHATPHIFPAMNRMMTAWVMQHLNLDETAANQLRHHYWKRYGATLCGLMLRHDVDPHLFLRDTHAFDDLPSLLLAERGLPRMLQRLTGRKIIFSNAPRAYVREVLQHLGLMRFFDSIVSFETIRFRPKPSYQAMAKIFAKGRAPGSRAVMVEDNLDNLKTAKRLRAGTVWFARPHVRLRARPHYVNRKVQSLHQLR